MSKSWQFPNLVVCNVDALLRSCICAHLRSFACICVFLRPTAFRTTAPRLGTAEIGGPNLCTNTVRRVSPANAWKALWGICIFPCFPLKTSILVHTKPLFWPVEALGFLELKTPLVCTFVPLKKKKCFLTRRLFVGNSCLTLSGGSAGSPKRPSGDAFLTFSAREGFDSSARLGGLQLTVCSC